LYIVRATRKEFGLPSLVWNPVAQVAKRSPLRARRGGHLGSTF
jgi:hypothetical protein